MTNRTPATWNSYLTESSTENIWKELNRIVGQHKLSRYSTKFDQLVEEGKFSRYIDLTQELFVTLLEKDRFKHYLETEMTDAEIEMEISQIELSNILTLELRRRYPEAYRISRRVVQLLQTSDKFKCIDQVDHRRVAYKSFGLKPWNTSRMTWPINLEDKVSNIPPYSRDIRHVGCAGDSQVIISNEELENLIVTILTTAEAPLTVKQIRKFVMSKLTIMDIHLTPIESYNEDEEKPLFEIADVRNTPEQAYFKNTNLLEIDNKVKDFLNKVWLASKQKDKQFTLMLNILNLYYLTSLNQWEVSKKLGVSDSLISGYRKTIDNLLQDLGFTTVEEARHFQIYLANVLKNKLDNL